MLVNDVLQNKSADVHQIIETATISSAAGLMASSRVGALVVEGPSGALSGLISEREITAAVVRWGGEAHRHTVREVMVSQPLVARPDDKLVDVTAIMTHHRARHMPVVLDGAVVGILSIGDVLKSRLDEKIHENLVLQDIARWRHAA
ncbi:CBS domain-containing protein [Sphingomonas echinoides]|jgi:CBS domain-containing protein|uniref:CBS domain-containing protein n=1 Tax=Sphingomonas echinoides TaxID=59803 RepID=UPI003EE8F44C